MRIIALLMFFFFLSPGITHAAFSFQIDSVNPTSISSKEEVVQVTLGVSDLPSESYFRVAWQEREGEPYFGYVQNNSGEWVKIKSLSSDCREYFKVSDTGTTSIVLTTKIGEDSEKSTGTYYLKAHRFTSTSCSVSNIVPSTQIEVILPTPPSPTPTPTSTPTPTATPSPTSPPPTPTPPKTPPPPKTPTLSPSPLTPISRGPTSSSSASPVSTTSATILSASDSVPTATASDESPPLTGSETLEKDQVGDLTFIGVLASTIILLFVIFRRLKLLLINAKVK